jgi:long-subunit acyl-CoA synthetase (AMP-forming)
LEEFVMDIALHRAYGWEKTKADTLWFTQPIGGDVLKTWTWKEGMAEARRMAAHLRSRELAPKTHIAIFSKNTAWWIFADLAIWMAGHVSIPLYPTLTADTIRQILEHSESKLVFVGKLDGYEKMADGIPKDMATIEMPLAPDTGFDKWEDLVKDLSPIEDSPERDLDELATIIYTSGSTGVPKGVMHSFRTMAVSITGVSERVQIRPDERMLSYLPLAHGFERWLAETGVLWNGGELYFAESITTFVTDLKRARPTLFVSVPRLWQKFQLGVSVKMPQKKLNFLLKIPIINNIIRKKILTGLGLDAVRFAGSGSAPIPEELINWYRNLGLELLEGYGMTENFNYSHCTEPGKVRVGYVGSAYPGVDVRITDEGEIQVKSPGTMMGYYKMEELTKDSITDDGFLKTGDRGEIDDEGRLKITGRTKELFKTSKGKYVAPAPIENKLLIHPALEMACVSGDHKPQPYAMVVLSETERPRMSDPANREEIATSLEAHLKAVNAKLDHHEQLALICVIGRPWAIDNGMLTPTMKLKRGAIEGEYGPLAQGWYDQKKPVVWQD